MWAFGGRLKLDDLSSKIEKNINWEGIKKLIRLLFRPINKAVRRRRIKKNALRIQKHYEEVIYEIKKSGRTKLRFAAYVIYDSTYGMDGTFKKMLEDEDHWDPYVVVIPDIARGNDHAIRTYKKTRNFFANRYGAERVLDGWNYKNDEYIDHIDEFDLVYYANPYDALVHKYHQIEYGCTKRVLPIHVSYGYDVGRYTTLYRMTSPELNYVWKLFTDTTYTYEDYIRFQIIKGSNVTLAGYSKMDSFSPNIKDNRKKKILIAPHHTVSMKELPLSNFLKYSNLILQLPIIYPEIDFVFRPHPLLFTTLINDCNWTEEQVEKYIVELKGKGVEYSSGGDYLDVFSECDAIIHDCGSFTVEWLFTGKPGCFVYNEKLKSKHLTTLMNKAIERYDIARSEEDILNFIGRISEAPCKEYKMDSWVKENIAINYPNVSEYIIKQIDIL